MERMIDDTAGSARTTIGQLLHEAVATLAATSDSPRLDAELLLGHVLKKSRAGVIAGSDERVSDDQDAAFRTLLQRRAQGRPVAQLLGYREFWSLKLAVTEATLVPRPETELLVERALSRLPAGRTVSLLDLGTGTGAVALAVALQRPKVLTTATDISAAALHTAQRNAAALGIDRMEFRCGNWLEAVPDRRFHMVVSNPPYVADDEWPDTGPELRFEPVRALRGGADGLDAIRTIISSAPSHLEPGGWLLIEHGFRQGDRVRKLFERAGFQQLLTSRDPAGHPRVTEGALPQPGGGQYRGRGEWSGS